MTNTLNINGIALSFDGTFGVAYCAETGRKLGGFTSKDVAGEPRFFAWHSRDAGRYAHTIIQVAEWFRPLLWRAQ